MPELLSNTQAPARRRSPRGALTRILLLVGAIVLFILAYQGGNQHRFGQPPAIEGVLMAPTMPLPAFALADASGQSFGRDQLTGHWTLLAFGDLAQARGQLAIQRLLEVFNHLAPDAELRQHLRLVLAAPRLPAALALDFGRLSPALLLVSGEAGDPSQLTSLLGEPADPDRNSRATLYLITPNASLLAFFPANQAAPAVASDLTLLAKWPLDALENLSHD